jgi:hypothetical protein
MNSLADKVEEIGRQLDANAGSLLALHVLLARLLGIFHFDEVLLASTEAALDQMRAMLVSSHSSAYKIDSFDATAATLIAILTANHFHRDK